MNHSSIVYQAALSEFSNIVCRRAFRGLKTKLNASLELCSTEGVAIAGLVEKPILYACISVRLYHLD